MHSICPATATVGQMLFALISLVIALIHLFSAYGLPPNPH